MSLQDENDGFLSGIFIKNVLENSPAGKSGKLKTGDRIIEVSRCNILHDLHLLSFVFIYCHLNF